MPIPALIGGAFGLASSFLSSNSQKRANEQNIKLAQMNNEWSERMMEKQHAYDLEMWNLNNEYNDPSKQVERLRAAGINPALALQNIGTGNATGGSSVSQPSPSMAQVNPVDYTGFSNAISNTVSTYLAIQRQNAELSAIDKRVDNETALARARIAEMYEETRNAKFRNELNDITKDLQVGIYQEDYLNCVQNRYYVEEQQKLIKQQTIAQNLINQNMPDKLAMEIAVMASQRDVNEFNSTIKVGRFIDELKKRGFKLDSRLEKVIFGTLIALHGFN